MLYLEFALQTLTCTIVGISFFYVFKESRITPVVEIKLFAAFIFLQFLGFTLELPLVILSEANEISTLGQSIADFASVPFALSLLALHFSFILPDFKLTYRSIVMLVYFVFIDTLFFILAYKWRGQNASVQDARLRFETTVYFDLYFLLFVISTLILIVIRYRSVKKAVIENEGSINSPRYLILLPIFMFLSLIVGGLIEFTNIPGESDNFPIALIFFLFAFSYRKGNHFFHVIPVKLYGLIIVDRASGLVFFSKGEEDDDNTEVLIGGLLTALNISLQEAIQTDQDLEELNFSNKVVHIAPYEDVTSLLITSKKTLMTTTIAKYFSKEFNRKYKEILQNQDENMKLSNYKGFTKTYEFITQYFAH